MYGRCYAAPAGRPVSGLMCQIQLPPTCHAGQPTLGQSLEIVPDGEKAAPSLLGACFLTQKDYELHLPQAALAPYRLWDLLLVLQLFLQPNKFHNLFEDYFFYRPVVACTDPSVLVWLVDLAISL